jgi:RNA polymerase sigma factor (sigma-70 family)
MLTMQGDAFERLYEQHARPLLAFLAYRTGDPVLAEDLLVDTFERVLRSRKPPGRKGSEKAWLYTIALNLVRDHARRRSAEERALERAEPVPLVRARSFEDLVSDREALGRAMETLSDEEREAVALRYGADLTIPEIARVLGEKETTVDGRVYRSLRKLRTAMGD